MQIFVAVLGALNYTYAEASLSQSLPDWIASHVRAFSYFGGVARQTVSDNLKAGITRACFHEPMVNRTYADLARHAISRLAFVAIDRNIRSAMVRTGDQIERTFGGSSRESATAQNLLSVAVGHAW